LLQRNGLTNPGKPDRMGRVLDVAVGFWACWKLLAVLAILCKRLTKPGKPDTTEEYSLMQDLGIQLLTGS